MQDPVGRTANAPNPRESELDRERSAPLGRCASRLLCQ